MVSNSVGGCRGTVSGGAVAARSNNSAAFSLTGDVTLDCQGHPAKAKGFVVPQRPRRGSICRNGSAQESANGNNLVQALGGATDKISLLSEPKSPVPTFPLASPPSPEVGTNFTPNI
jgi:hypothetical protein